MSEAQGYVYILTNPSFKDDWVKIGKSSRPVDVRSKELDNTAVPLPFCIYATLKTAKYNAAERFIHKMIDMVAPDIRIRKEREFFNITPRKAYDILKLCSELLDDAEVQNPEDLDELQTSVERSTRLTFEMLEIPIGSDLTFCSDDSITVKVLDKGSMVRIDGQDLSLSAAAKYIYEKAKSANNSGSYQGGLYFKYNGEKLTDMRRRLGR